MKTAMEISMSAIARVFSSASVAAVLALIIAACSVTYEYHGYVPTGHDLRAVKVGESTPEDVLETVGRPASAGFLDPGTWYYAAAKIRRRAFRDPEFTDQQVVAISFNEEGTVSNVERFGLKNGQPVVLNRRITETDLGQLSIVDQLMKSFGRIDPGELLSRQ